jgi:hypothetical protein
MELKQVAALVVIVGGIVLSLAVGFWDWRAGVACAGVLLIAGGLTSFKES